MHHSAKQQPPKCLFPLVSSLLLSLQSLTQGEQGSLEQLHCAHLHPSFHSYSLAF